MMFAHDEDEEKKDGEIEGPGVAELPDDAFEEAWTDDEAVEPEVEEDKDDKSAFGDDTYEE